MAQLLKRGENRWQVLIFRGRDATGKRQFHCKTIRGTKKQALAYAREVETKVSTGDFSEPTKKNVAEFLQSWLDGPAAQRLRPQTLASYSKLIRNYVLPALGERKLSQLRLPEIEALYSDMRARGLSPRTIRYTHSVLRSALNHCVRARLITHNPSDYATLPRQERKEMRCLSAAETVRFLAASKQDKWHALFELLVRTGLRPGEALGLRWSDISASTISVQRALVNAGKDWIVAEPKTRRSRRSVLIGDSTLKALQALRRVQAEEKLLAGPRYIDNDFVFATETGTPLDIKNITVRHYRKILKSAGLPALTLYGLRHSAATLMMESGTHPKVAADILGHSSVMMTLDVYSHVMGNMQQDAIRRVEQLLAAAAQ